MAVLEEVAGMDEAESLAFFVDGASGGFFEETVEMGVRDTDIVGDLLGAYVLMAVFSQITLPYNINSNKP